MKLASIEDLKVEFPNGKVVIDGLNLQLNQGEIHAIVGESGSGKSITALALMRLLPGEGELSQGKISFGPKALHELPVHEMRSIRGREIAMIFQEPMTSLNPVQKVGAQVAEAIRLHESISKKAALVRVQELFEQVRIPDAKYRLNSYPHELSGGLRQRVMIAMALALKPKLLIADEPTTALDVSVQAQILQLLKELVREQDTSVLLITHDFGVVNEICDRISVMYAGEIVESGTRREIFSGARHPYTLGLLRAVPALARRGERLFEIPGLAPAPGTWDEGCRFRERCAVAANGCEKKQIEHILTDGRLIRCHRALTQRFEFSKNGDVSSSPISFNEGAIDVGN